VAVAGDCPGQVTGRVVGIANSTVSSSVRTGMIGEP
jgi:hypothetical protein